MKDIEINWGAIINLILTVAIVCLVVKVVF